LLSSHFHKLCALLCTTDLYLNLNVHRVSKKHPSLACYIRLGGHRVGIGPHSSLRVVYSGCKDYVLMRLICSKPSRKWPPYVIGQSVILSSSGFFFFFLLSFYLFSSPILSRHRLDAYHTSTHNVVLGRI